MSGQEDRFKELVDDIKGALFHPEALDELLRAHAHQLAEKIQTEGPAAIAAWFNYYAPGDTQPSRAERVAGAAKVVAALIAPEAS